MSNVDAGSVVRRFYEGWNSGSIDFSGLVAEDIVNHQPEAEPEQGQQRFEEAIRNVMRAVPDSHWTVTDLLTDGDRVAARTTWSGTYQGHHDSRTSPVLR
jgi:predicted ester cyclase